MASETKAPSYYKKNPDTGEYNSPEQWRKVGKLLKKARESRGWSVAEIASKIGVSASAVHGYESIGNAPPERLRAISGVLGLDYDELRKIHGPWPQLSTARHRIIGKENGKAKPAPKPPVEHVVDRIPRNIGERINLMKDALAGLNNREQEKLVTIVQLLLEE